MDWLDEIEARANAATPGPWRVNKMRSYEDHDECRLELPYDDLDMTKYDDAEFIAHSREDVPRLVAEVRTLRADLARVTAERDAAVQDLKDLVKYNDYCKSCKHYATGYQSVDKGSQIQVDDCRRDDCEDGERWEWAGPPHNYIGEEAVGPQEKEDMTNG